MARMGVCSIVSLYGRGEDLVVVLKEKGAVKLGTDKVFWEPSGTSGDLGDSLVSLLAEGLSGIARVDPPGCNKYNGEKW